MGVPIPGAVGAPEALSGWRKVRRSGEGEPVAAETGVAGENLRLLSWSRCFACALSAPGGKAALGRRGYAVRALLWRQVHHRAGSGRAGPLQLCRVGSGRWASAGGVSARLVWAEWASASLVRAGVILRDWGLRGRGGLCVVPRLAAGARRAGGTAGFWALLFGAYGRGAPQPERGTRTERALLWLNPASQCVEGHWGQNFIPVLELYFSHSMETTVFMTG